MTVSTLILTRNEEVNLPGCMDSLSWCDDIVVFDSFSTDRTVRIAEAGGARVFQHEFVNYGAQREAARTTVEYKHPWVLTVDADERVEPSLADEVCAVAAENGRGCTAYRVRRKDHFMGRWIGHATLYPSWFIRFYKNSEIYYTERAVHEHPVVRGRLGELKGHLFHYSFNKGFFDWLKKHEKYAAMEAQEAIRELENVPLDWSRLAEFEDPVVRRRFLKSFSYRMPLRPVLRFAYMYFLRRGCLDGMPGLVYCILLSYYEYLIGVKMRESRLRKGGIVTTELETDW